MATLTDNPYDEKTKERKQQFVDPKENEQETQALNAPDGTLIQGGEQPSGVASVQNANVNNDTAQMTELYPEEPEAEQPAGTIPRTQTFMTEGVEGGDTLQQPGSNGGTQYQNDSVTTNDDIAAQGNQGTPNEKTTPGVEKVQGEVKSTATTGGTAPVDRNAVFGEKIKSLGLNGNVDHMNLPAVTAKQMRDKNYGGYEKMADGDAVLPILPLSRNKKSELALLRKNSITITPVSKDGKLYSSKDLNNYLAYLNHYSGGDINKALEIDRKYKGMIVGANLSDNTIAKLMKAHRYRGGEKDYSEHKALWDQRVGEVSTDGLKNTLDQISADYVDKKTGKPMDRDFWGDSDAALYDSISEELKRREEETSGNTPPTDVEVKTDATNAGTTTTTGKTNTGTTVTVEKKPEVSTGIVTTSPGTTAAVDYTQHPSYKKSFDTFSKKTDDELLKIVEKNEKGETEDQKIAAALAKDILSSRGKSGTELSNPEIKPRLARPEGEEESRDYITLQSPWGTPPLIGRQNSIESYRLSPSGASVPSGTSSSTPTGTSTSEAAKTTDTPTFTADEVRRDLDKDRAELKKIQKDKDADPKKVEDLKNKINQGEETLRSLGEDPDKKSPDRVKLQETPLYKKAAAAVKEAQDALDAFNASLKDGSAYAAIAKPFEDDIKAHDEEDKKIAKRQRTARIIANIGDLLQGVINSVGTLYGANSAELTSLSERAHSSAKEENTERAKRRKELVKARDDMAERFKKNSEKELAQHIAALKDANDKLWKLEENDYTTKEKHENSKELEAIKAENQEERDERRQEEQKDLIELRALLTSIQKNADFEHNKELKELAAKLSAWVKGLPTFAQANPSGGSSGGGGSSRRRRRRSSHSSSRQRNHRNRGRGGHSLIHVA